MYSKSESPAAQNFERSASVASTCSSYRVVRQTISLADVLLMDVVMLGRDGGIQLLDLQKPIRNVVLVDTGAFVTPCPVVVQVDSVGVTLSCGAGRAFIPVHAIHKITTFVEWRALGVCGLLFTGSDGFNCALGLNDGRMRSALHKIVAIRTGVKLPQAVGTRPTTRSPSAPNVTARKIIPQPSRSASVKTSAPLQPYRRSQSAATPPYCKGVRESASTPTRPVITPTTELEEEKSARRAALVAQVQKHRHQQYDAAREKKVPSGTPNKVEDAKFDRRRQIEKRLDDERMLRVAGRKK